MGMSYEELRDWLLGLNYDHGKFYGELVREYREPNGTPWYMWENEHEEFVFVQISLIWFREGVFGLPCRVWIQKDRSQDTIEERNVTLDDLSTVVFPWMKLGSK